MNINIPIINQEIVLKKDALLVSKTDLTGIITYINDEFINVSGYTRDELINARHNIVRHPDMPSVDFKDLWITLKSHGSWQGVIKNRAKSGNYYWVEANIIPVFKNGKAYEYLSIQHVPSREKVKKEQLLHRLRNSKGKRRIIRAAKLAAIIKSSKEIIAGKKIALAQALLLAPVFYLMYRLFLAEDYSLLISVAVSVTLASTLRFNTFKSFASMLKKCIDIFYRLIEKKFGNAPDSPRNDLFSDFQRTLYVMEADFNLAQTKDHASTTRRIGQAMDHMHAGVMVINNNSEIVYMNNSLLDVFKKAANAKEHGCRISMPTLPDANNDSFDKDAKLRHLSANLEQPHSSELHIAGHVIRFSVSS